MAVFPSDHMIADAQAFRETLAFATRCVARHPDYLLTLGTVPDHPETGYGYISPGRELHGEGPCVLREVEAFVEKPDHARARTYIESGYLWNAGMFVWRADTILEAFCRHMPAMYASLMKVQGLEDSHDAALKAFYGEAEPISIDYAIMEKATRVGVIPADFGWNDVGSWDALGKILDSDTQGNAVHGEVRLKDSKGNVVWAGEKKIVLIGMEDTVVVEGEGAILVCPRQRCQEVSSMARQMKAEEFPEGL